MQKIAGNLQVKTWRNPVRKSGDPERRSGPNCAVSFCLFLNFWELQYVVVVFLKEKLDTKFYLAVNPKSLSVGGGGGAV